MLLCRHWTDNKLNKAVIKNPATPKTRRYSLLLYLVKYWFFLNLTKVTNSVPTIKRVGLHGFFDHNSVNARLADVLNIAYSAVYNSNSALYHDVTTDARNVSLPNPGILFGKRRSTRSIASISCLRLGDQQFGLCFERGLTRKHEAAD